MSRAGGHMLAMKSRKDFCAELCMVALHDRTCSGCDTLDLHLDKCAMSTKVRACECHVKCKRGTVKKTAKDVSASNGSCSALSTCSNFLPLYSCLLRIWAVSSTFQAVARSAEMVSPLRNVQFQNQNCINHEPWGKETFSEASGSLVYQLWKATPRPSMRQTSSARINI